MSDALRPGGDSRVRHRPWKLSASKTLLLIFFLSLPLPNPWVRGDGVGYYAYVRALLVDHNLNFEQDWLHANQSFRQFRVDSNGHLTADNYTVTHHVDNHFSIGPAILWAPFLAVVHLAILSLNRFGWHLQADGFSRPYMVTVAAATALYGFAGLYLSFALARQFVADRWALLATIGIWFGSSLPVYMYLNPSWSHALSAFVVALFLWYWHRTMSHRSFLQWAVLGIFSGLMIDVYYPNAILLLAPELEVLVEYFRASRPDLNRTFDVIARQLLYLSTTMLLLLPTFIIHHIIYGHAFASGYTERWFWADPKLMQVLFSSNHGLFSWTPILIPSVLGLALLWKHSRMAASASALIFLAFWYFIASYENWHGISSFGNRFFVSLTPLFVLGLAMILQWLSTLFVSPRRASWTAVSLVAVFILWNVGLILQWGINLIPARGPVSWRLVARNQFTVVPQRVADVGRSYLWDRRDLMDKIEKSDVHSNHLTNAK